MAQLPVRKPDVQGPPPGVNPANPPQPKPGPKIPDVAKPNTCELKPCQGTASKQLPVGYPNEDGTVSVVNVWSCGNHDAFGYEDLPDRARSPHVLDHSHFSVDKIRGPQDGGAQMAPRKTADAEDFQVIDDGNLLDGVEARVRQLEAEKAAFAGFLEEAKAVGEEDEEKAHQERLDKLNKRLAVVYKRRDALLKNIAIAEREEKAKQPQTAE